MTPSEEQRRAELVGSLAAVRARIADACAAAGRDVREITLIAVTKTYPVSDVAVLAELGAFDVGESRDQEAVDKVVALRAVAPQHAARVRWHFVGQLQSRKVRSVAGYATAVHSLDRQEIVGRLSAAVTSLARAPMQVFVQASLDGDPARGGVPAAGVTALADAVAAADGLQLRGVMAVAPLGAEPDKAFADLAKIAARVRADHPEAVSISAGMSGDLEAALRHGATHVRVGTALLGRRSPFVG